MLTAALLRKSRKRQPELEPSGAAQAHYSSQVFPRVPYQTGASANAERVMERNDEKYITLNQKK